MVNDARDDDSGEFREKYPLEAVYDALLADAEGRDGLGTARGVADRIDSSRVTAHRKLESLASAGYVRKTKVAGRAVWMPTDDTPTFDDTGDLLDDGGETEAEGDGSGGDSGGDADDDGGGRSWREDRLGGGGRE